MSDEARRQTLSEVDRKARVPFRTKLTAIAVGLVIIAACPGGTTSNVFAFLARGNLALSILMTAAASLITVITLPIFANLAIDLFKVSRARQLLHHASTG